ncbi:hypothetical protein HPB51_010427 [Rhipicephalus microplus]|uniref:CCHC-type domain-containing protein n=1 Tax=Rhipicephalus microplus TaxID=6941 RepID=A0A9J6E8L5_RHIMP|nr:hypothetical protein HPB51_010427 [Rhipicephalus microplus]
MLPCGTVGHRPNACPNPDNQWCIHCGAKVELTPEGPAKHDCQPECLICGENHFTAQRSASKIPEGMEARSNTAATWTKKQAEEPSALSGLTKKRSPCITSPSRSNPQPDEVEAAYLRRRGFPVTGKPAQTERENRALKASQAATPPPPSEPVAMHTSDCSNDEQDTQSDVSGNTSVSKTVVGASNDTEGRLSRLEAKLEEQSKMILEQTKLTVQDIIPQQLNLSVQAAMQDLKQSILPILTAMYYKPFKIGSHPSWTNSKLALRQQNNPDAKLFIVTWQILNPRTTKPSR